MVLALFSVGIAVTAFCLWGRGVCDAQSAGRRRASPGRCALLDRRPQLSPHDELNQAGSDSVSHGASGTTVRRHWTPRAFARDVVSPCGLERQSSSQIDSRPLARRIPFKQRRNGNDTELANHDFTDHPDGVAASAPTPAPKHNQCIAKRSPLSGRTMVTTVSRIRTSRSKTYGIPDRRPNRRPSRSRPPRRPL